MAAREILLTRQYDALSEIRRVVDKHALEVGERLRLMVPRGAIPTSGNFPNETVTFLAESVAVLARLVDQHAEANRPKRRGRPPKST